MRTNIVIDEQLMQEALELTGYQTKRKLVDESLKLLVAMEKQKQIRSLRGKLSWEGDLEAMRRDV